MLEGFTLNLFCRHVCPWWSFGRSFSVGMTGLFYSAITPFSTGGQPMQIYAMNKMGLDTGKAGSIIAMKTLVYQVVMVLCSLVLVSTQLGFFQTNISNFSFVTVIGLLSNSAFIAAVLTFTVSAGGTDRALRFVLRLLYRMRIVRRPIQRYQRIHAQLSMFHKSAGIMGRSFKLYFTTALLTAVQITVNSLISYFIYLSFALPVESVSAVTMVAAQVFVSMVSAFVPLPGASGGAEGSFVIFFNKFFGHDVVSRHVPVADPYVLCQHRPRRLLLRVGRKAVRHETRRLRFRGSGGLREGRYLSLCVSASGGVEGFSGRQDGSPLRFSARRRNRSPVLRRFLRGAGDR